MASEISIEKIKELRDRTGVGMGKCKEALAENGGDIEKALTYLREKGIAGAVKKEGRSANEGTIAVSQTDDAVYLVEINAETDFVTNNDKFKEFVDNILAEIINTKPKSLSDFLGQKFSKDPSMTIDEYRATIVQTISENIQIRRLLVLSHPADVSLGVYSHMGGKIVTVVEVAGSGHESPLAKSLAMQVAAANPDYLTPETVPQDVVSSEREIARKQMEGKPEHIVDKILEGKLKSYYDAVCLLNQKYIKDDTVTVSELVEKRAKEIGAPLKVTNFVRWSVGQ